MALPTTFVDLAAAYTSPANTFVNIIGVVVDIQTPTITAKGQYMFTFKLLDQRFQESMWVNEGLRVRYFKGDLQSLPKVQQNGDVVLLRNAKITSFNQQPMAMSNWQTETTVFPAASIPTPNYEPAYQGTHRLQCHGKPLDLEKLSLPEQSYVIRLKHDMSETLESIAHKETSGSNAIESARPSEVPTGPAALKKRSGPDLSTPEPKKVRSNKKLKLIKELQHRDFADIFAQVVKKFPTNYGSCDLYVTDYTENKLMYLYSPPEEEDDREREGDTFGYTGAPKRAWPGPWGWLVLKLELRDPHAHYANREVEEGDFVLLKNVRMKVFNHLEGNMWPDPRNPEEVKICKLRNPTAPEIEAIRERKDKYWDTRTAKMSKNEQPLPKKKPTRTERKKQMKERKAEQEAAASDNAKSKAGGLIGAPQNGAVNGHTKANVNPHIRCSHEEVVPISSVKAIQDYGNEWHTAKKRDQTTYVLPFINVKRRARVRVVDYEPRQLEDFAIAEALDDDKSEDLPIIDYESSPKYEWFFSLQLEDASQPKAVHTEEDRIWVNVAHTDAQYLFGNDLEDPSDLRNDLRLLSKLREKLCILWGNLEEKSDDQPLSNRPFECCLAEYAIGMDEDDPEKSLHPFGFKRMYSMFGVTIL